MNFNRNSCRKFYLIILSSCLFSCVGNGDMENSISPAKMSSKTINYIELKALPKPNGPIPVSVYSFRDQTGQYKATTGVSSFSTAVSQGALSMLVQTLTESDWFIPLEREGLQNILTERKIIRAARQSEKGEIKSPELPPLRTSLVILEGGITSYESNTETGGFGIGYFGYNISDLYRKDDVTVYLRAVDVRTGRVLVSVSTTKSILSEEVKGGLFRYVSFTRLAELESGYSTNEPVQFALLKAIQKAVGDLVLEGIIKGVWSVANPKELDNSKIFKRYKNEKAGLIENLKINGLMIDLSNNDSVTTTTERIVFSPQKIEKSSVNVSLSKNITLSTNNALSRDVAKVTSTENGFGYSGGKAEQEPLSLENIREES